MSPLLDNAVFPHIPTMYTRMIKKLVRGVYYIQLCTTTGINANKKVDGSFYEMLNLIKYYYYDVTLTWRLIRGFLSRSITLAFEYFPSLLKTRKNSRTYSMVFLISTLKNLVITILRLLYSFKCISNQRLWPKTLPQLIR